MSEKFISDLLTSNGQSISEHRRHDFKEFCTDVRTLEIINEIRIKESQIVENWKRKKRLADLLQQSWPIGNGTVNVAYSAKLDFQLLSLNDISIEKVEGSGDIGLVYEINEKSILIHGLPSKNGDFHIMVHFRFRGANESEPLSTKKVILVINPDPKTLWKNLDSDKEDIYWKKDDFAKAGILGDKHVVGVSKRGRSHQHVGSFRDDHFDFKYFDKTEWSIVVVSDGAGGAKFSRKGSELACAGVIEYFDGILNSTNSNTESDLFIELEQQLRKANLIEGELPIDLANLSKKALYPAVLHVNKKIKAHADEAHAVTPNIFDDAKKPIEHFHATLIFCLFKKIKTGYVLLTFGVGDCPIAVIGADEKKSMLINTLDVGEFGGGTRFITQTEIYHSKEIPMSSRFNCEFVSDFSYMFLMSDGIYDPKFIVEENLKKLEKWQDFIADLNGKNDDEACVEFNPDNENIQIQLSNWMDFWSTGEHDDRTLVVVYS